MAELKIAVVTGSNKGIGLEIVRKLANDGFKTILTSRSSEQGQIAANSIGMGVECRQLDISSQDSINEFCSNFGREFGKCDVLVNNAGIAFKNSDPTPFTEQAEPTLQTNFFGTEAITNAMLPYIRASKSPRIVNVASVAGSRKYLPDQSRKDFFSSDLLTFTALDAAMHEFVEDVKSGQHREKGWSNSCYGTSKLAVIAWNAYWPELSQACW